MHPGASSIDLIDLSFEQAKLLSEAYIISTFIYRPLIWMFCSKTANNLINKIHKRSLRVGRCKYGRFIKDRSWTIHENNIHTLLTLLTHLSSYNARIFGF